MSKLLEAQNIAEYIDAVIREQYKFHRDLDTRDRLYPEHKKPRDWNKSNLGMHHFTAKDIYRQVAAVACCVKYLKYFKAYLDYEVFHFAGYSIGVKVQGDVVSVAVKSSKD